MSWSVAAPFMLWGLLGISIPVIIHLLSRRRAVTIDWGAMQFLDIGRRARRKFQITELLLMAGPDAAAGARRAGPGAAVLAARSRAPARWRTRSGAGASRGTSCSSSTAPTAWIARSAAPRRGPWR